MQSKAKNNEALEIDILQILRALWRRVWAIILAAAICGGAAYAYGHYMITPLYQTSAQLYVNNSAISFGVRVSASLPATWARRKRWSIPIL